jgi:hypothetical protein
MIKIDTFYVLKNCNEILSVEKQSFTITDEGAGKSNKTDKPLLFLRDMIIYDVDKVNSFLCY